MVGDKIKTDLGEVTVLDIQEKYLILLDEARFVKANGYNKNSAGKVYWQGGEYYQTFTELIKSIEG